MHSDIEYLHSTDVQDWLNPISDLNIHTQINVQLSHNASIILQYDIVLIIISYFNQ